MLFRSSQDSDVIEKASTKRKRSEKSASHNSIGFSECDWPAYFVEVCYFARKHQTTSQFLVPVIQGEAEISQLGPLCPQPLSADLQGESFGGLRVSAIS